MNLNAYDDAVETSGQDGHEKEVHRTMQSALSMARVLQESKREEKPNVAAIIQALETKIAETTPAATPRVEVKPADILKRRGDLCRA